MKQVPILILLIVSILLGLPLLRPGVPVSDDWVNMTLRATAFHQGFLDGQFPVRVLPHLFEGYGYPVTNFLYPLPLYLSEPLVLIGLTPIMAIKVVTVAAYFFGNLGFVWMTRRLGASGRLWWWLSLIWMLEPNRLLALYQRGAVGEVLLLGLLPWIVALIAKPISNYKVLLAIGFGLGVLPALHNSLALVAAVIVAVFWLSRPTSLKPSFFQLLTAGVVAILSSAWFVVPALLELSYTKAPMIVISTVEDHFPSALIWLPLLVSVSFATAIQQSLKRKIFGVVGIILALLLVPVSTPIWYALSLDRLLQFPFRLLPLISLILMILVSGQATVRLPRLVWILPAVILLGLTQFSPLSWQPLTQDYLDTNFHSSNTHNEFAPVSAPDQPLERDGRDFWFENDKTQVLLTDVGFSSVFVQAEVRDDSLLHFSRFAYPGWQVSIDGQPVEHQTNENGLISVLVPASKHSNHLRDIRLQLLSTPIQRLSNTISLLTWLALGLLLVPVVPFSKRAAIVAFVVGLAHLSHHLITNLDDLTTRYDPVAMEQKYLASQWVDPRSQQPIGDSGLYAHAGWEYTKGTNPILINSEMPPFGKYVIGWLLRLTQSQAMVGLIGTSFGLMSVWLLASWVLRSKILALLPVGILLTQPIILSSSLTTMLDTWQLGWLSLSLWSLTKAKESKSPLKWMLLMGLTAGGVLATKFYLTGFLCMLALCVYCVLFARKLLKYLPLSWLMFVSVHAGSYLVFFMDGQSLRDYLGVQKYIFEFYRQGSPGVPLLSYWELVFLNHWRVWWGGAWGQTRVLSASEWSLWWPVSTILTFLTAIGYLYSRLKKLTIDPTLDRLLVVGVWLAVFSGLLSVIGGWPHYFILFLPFSLLSLPYLLKKLESIWSSS